MVSGGPKTDGLKMVKKWSTHGFRGVQNRWPKNGIQMVLKWSGHAGRKGPDHLNMILIGCYLNLM